MKYRFDEFSTLKNDFENQNFEIFDKVIHNFGKCDDDTKIGYRTCATITRS